MRFLKTNTATRVTVGPFLDATDAKTPKTALTATNEKLTLCVDDAGVPTLVLDANATASGGSNDFVHITGDDAGMYDLELAAANVNYLGRAILTITYATDHLPVFHEFMILPANVYDSWFGTDKQYVDAVEINSSTTAAINLALSAGIMLVGSVDATGTNSSTQIETTATSEDTPNHFVGRAFFFTSGVLLYQAAKITAYSYTGGRGRFTVEQMTDTAAGNFIIV
jgi:hypothetical protein